MKSKNDALIRKALYKVALRETEYAMALPDVQFEPSVSYSEKIKELIFNTDNTSSNKKPSRTKIAVIIIAAVLASLIVTACVFRKPIANFFEEKFDTHTRITSSSTNKNNGKINTIYSPSYMPTEYSKAYENVMLTSVDTQWKSENNTISLYQCSANKSIITVNTEKDDYTILTIGEKPVYCLYNRNTYTFAWSDGTYNFVLSSGDSIDKEELIKIISGLEPTQPEAAEKTN